MLNSPGKRYNEEVFQKNCGRKKCFDSSTLNFLIASYLKAKCVTVIIKQRITLFPSPQRMHPIDSGDPFTFPLDNYWTNRVHWNDFV